MLELLAAWKIMPVYFGAKIVDAGATRVAESGGDRDHGIPTDICEEIHRLGRGRVALCGGFCQTRRQERT